MSGGRAGRWRRSGTRCSPWPWRRGGSRGRRWPGGWGGAGGGLASFAGVLLTVLGPGLVAGYAGAALWALGVCLVFPAAVSAGGETPGRPADALPPATTIGYGGFLVGPPLIGLLADHVGLGRALLVLCVLAGGIAVLAPAGRSRRPQPAPARLGPGALWAGGAPGGQARPCASGGGAPGAAPLRACPPPPAVRAAGPWGFEPDPRRTGT